MTTRERLGSSTRLPRDVDDDVAPTLERQVTGKRTLLDDDVVAPAPGKMTRLDTDPYALSPVAALRYARAISKDPSSESSRVAAISAIDASKPAPGSIADQLRKKLDVKSDNLHWSPGRGKIIVIDMQ